MMFMLVNFLGKLLSGYFVYMYSCRGRRFGFGRRIWGVGEYSLKYVRKFGRLG